MKITKFHFKIFTLLCVTVAFFDFPVYSQWPESEISSLRARHQGTRMIQPAGRSGLTMSAAFGTRHSSELKSATRCVQRLDKMVYNIWDKAAGIWESQYKHEYNYDSCGNMVEAQFSSKDLFTDLWTGQVRECYTWHSKGKISRCIAYNWSSKMNRWEADSKQELTYTKNGILTSASFFRWDYYCEEWVPEFKLDYESDNYGKILRSQVNSWNSSLNQWIKTWKDEYSYDDSGKKTQLLSFNWMANTEKWKTFSKDEYSFDSYGNLQQTVYYSWSDSTKWNAVAKDVFVYDQDQNLTRFEKYQRNSTTGLWKEYYKEENSFNNAYCFSDLLLPYNDEHTDLYFKHQLISLKEYEMNSAGINWSPFNHIQFTYSQIKIDEGPAVDVTDFSSPGIEVFPNPASDHITVRCPDNPDRFYFRLMDLTGREMFSQSIANNEKIGLRKFAPGLYVYQISAGEKSRSGRLVIR